MTARPSGLAAVLALVSLLPASSLHAESRFENVRLIIGTHGRMLFRAEGFHDVGGVLTSDAAARQLRFESADGTMRQLPFDRLISVHYEESKYPEVLFGRSRSYLTIHYLNIASESHFEIFRLPKEIASDLLVTVERDAGITIDRGPPTSSFLGLPVHIAVGATVFVTDDAGRRTKGVVTRFSESSIELQASGRFDRGSVRRIDVSDRIWNGVVIGVLLAFIPAAVIGTGCAQAPDDDPCGSTFVGVLAAGGLAGGLIDGGRLRSAYDRGQQNESRRPVWRPSLAANRKSIRLTFGFGF